MSRNVEVLTEDLEIFIFIQYNFVSGYFKNLISRNIVRNKTGDSKNNSHIRI